ncbi:MAG: hypothetical protein FWE23_08945 [Chitinivibrionia bacterium]|nr:hypothetical protein [Chitinivibrionia bacterium]
MEIEKKIIDEDAGTITEIEIEPIADQGENANDVAAVKEDLKEVFADVKEAEAAKEAGDVQGAAEKEAEAEAAADVITRKYSEDEVAEALQQIEESGYLGKLFGAMRRGDEPKSYEVSEDDISAVVDAVQSSNGEALVDALQDICRKSADYPAIDIVSGFIRADNTRQQKRKLKKLLKSMELTGDIGYELTDDDDIEQIDSEDFKKSKYGEVLSKLAKKGIRSLDQLDFGKDIIKQMLNEGLVPKDAKEVKVIKAAPASTASVSLGGESIDDRETLARKMADAIKSSDKSEYARLKKLYIGG